MMNDIQDLRRNLRQEKQAIRRRMTSEDVRELSEKISGRVMELEPVRTANTIMGFLSIDNEVDLMPLLDELKKMGKTVLLPRVIDTKERIMEAVEYKSLEEMHEGAYGILEPEGTAYSQEDIDAVLVPGLVFDANGYRLGYGAGYYDRFLPSLRNNTFICGICYEFQVCDDIHSCEGDIPVHWIVTDRSELLINSDFF